MYTVNQESLAKAKAKAKEYIKQNSIKAGIYLQTKDEGLLFLEGSHDTGYGLIIDGDSVKVFSPL